MGRFGRTQSLGHTEAEVNLTIGQVQAALPRIANGLAKYSWLQKEFPIRDVSSDSEYRKRFGGFYRVRRSASWRDTFFQILERGKSAPLTFGEALRALQAGTGKVEASFASKLVATLDPVQPVIDSVVLKNIGFKLPAAASADRFSEIESLHRRLAEVYWEYLASESGRDLVKRFRESYPDAQVTETKMLDLVLWQSR
jgi:hypothetical protein